MNTCVECGHDTDSQAIDLCRACEDRVQLVCAETSDLVGSGTSSYYADTLRIGRKEYSALFALFLETRGRIRLGERLSRHDTERIHDAVLRVSEARGLHLSTTAKTSWLEPTTARREFRDVQPQPQQEPRQ